MMSDGKKFAFKAPETAEQRLDEIERKYGVIQERIQAYDEVLNQFASLKQELKTARQNTASLHDFFESFSREIKSSIASLVAQIQPLKNVQDSHTATLQGHSSTISSMLEGDSNEREEIRTFIAEIEKKLAEFLLIRAQFNGYLEDIKRKTAEIINKQNSNEQSLDKLYADHIKFKDKSEEIHDSLNKEIKKNKQAIEGAPDLSDWASKLYGRVSSDMAYRDKQATAYVDKKIEALAQEFAANPLSAQSIKAELASEIQALSLDSKNAYLKSNNCSTQIQLLEKKLENLNLIIKKYELNK